MNTPSDGSTCVHPAEVQRGLGADRHSRRSTAAAAPEFDDRWQINCQPTELAVGKSGVQAPEAGLQTLRPTPPRWPTGVRGGRPGFGCRRPARAMRCPDGSGRTWRSRSRSSRPGLTAIGSSMTGPGRRASAGPGVQRQQRGLGHAGEAAGSVAQSSSGRSSQAPWPACAGCAWWSTTCSASCPWSARWCCPGCCPWVPANRSRRHRADLLRRAGRQAGEFVEHFGVGNEGDVGLVFVDFALERVGLRRWRGPSRCRRPAPTRRSRTVPQRGFGFLAHRRDTGRDSSSTLPLARMVRTLANPASVKAAATSAILRLTPPTLTPRRKAAYLVMLRFHQAPR